MTKAIFLHIPKTAGTTIYNVFEREYEKGETFFIKTINNKADPTEFAQLPQERKDRIKLLRGHLDFGIHEFWDGYDPIYITLFRQPIKRIESLYHFSRATDDHYLHEKTMNMTIDEFATSKLTTELDNGYIRHFIEHDHIPIGGINEEHRKMALDRIEKFFIVGITERFDESMLLFQEKLKWPKIPGYVNKNISKKRKKATLSKESWDYLSETNKHDQFIYDWALEKFENSIKSINGFEKRLSKLHSFNQYWRIRDAVGEQYYKLKRMVN